MWKLDRHCTTRESSKVKWQSEKLWDKSLSSQLNFILLVSGCDESESDNGHFHHQQALLFGWFNLQSEAATLTWCWFDPHPAFATWLQPWAPIWVQYSLKDTCWFPAEAVTNFQGTTMHYERRFRVLRHTPLWRHSLWWGCVSFSPRILGGPGLELSHQHEVL